jgi:hypothetical protein
MELNPDNVMPSPLDFQLLHMIPGSGPADYEIDGEISWLLGGNLLLRRQCLPPKYPSQDHELCLKPPLELWCKDGYLYVIYSVRNEKGSPRQIFNRQCREAETLFCASKLVSYTLDGFVVTFRRAIENSLILEFEETESCCLNTLTPTHRFHGKISFGGLDFYVSIVDILPGVPLTEAWPGLDEESKKIYATKCCEVVKKLGNLDYGAYLGVSTSKPPTQQLRNLRLTHSHLDPDRIMVNGVEKPLGVQMWDQFKFLPLGSIRADIRHQVRNLGESNPGYEIFEEWVCLLDASLEDLGFPDDSKDEKRREL